MHSTSTTPFADEGSEDEQVDIQPGMPREKKKRSSRACDQCRKTKSKCERPPGSVACRNCLSLKQECTFLGPSRKRGPPKGYTTALENRIHRLEALWGVLLSSGDPRAQTLVADIAQDSLARDILGEVDTGAFGPVGRSQILAAQLDMDASEPGPSSVRGFTSSRARREQLLLGNDEDPSLPSYQWQDLLKNHIMARGVARRQGHSSLGGDTISAPYAFALDDRESSTAPEYGLALPPVKQVSPPLGSLSLATQRPHHDAETIWRALYDREVPSSGEESEYESDDSANAVGQLSLNEKQQVGFHGKTSGMHILAKPHRSDSLNAGGIWHLPQTRFWPVSQRGRPMIEEDLHLKIESWPSQRDQNKLLELYWTYVQPVLPVLDKDKFLAEYNAQSGRTQSSQYPSHDQSKPAQRVPRLLLLSMFTIAARYSDTPRSTPAGNMWEAGCDFLDDAKLILNWTYDCPRPSTCQAIILLAYREFGIGAISQAWIYMGMAIRMATDLGLHRAADRWQRSGRVLFTEAERSCRKRVWHCCVILDRIMAFAMGRPISIRERDYDTALPSTQEDEEYEGWTPKPQDGSIPRPARTLSTLNAGASLSSILGLIVDTIYACRSGVSFVVRHAESFKMAGLLEDWYLKMPEHLRYNMDVDETVPLPHVLTLHMMYWCVMLLVHRPFIRHHKQTQPQSNAPEHDIGVMSDRSFSRSAHAACRVTDLVDVYCKTWDMSRANAFLSWYVLGAGVMHVATLTMRLGNQSQARLGLQRCLEAFDRMKVVWPSSARAWQLLYGAQIDLSGTPNESGMPQTGPQPSGPQTGHRVPSNGNSSALYTESLFDTQPRPELRSFPSLTSTLGQTAHGPPPNMSYFPGYDHWPPESLIFEPPFLHAAQGQGLEPFSEGQAAVYDFTTPMNMAALTAPMEMPASHGIHGTTSNPPDNPTRQWGWPPGAPK